MWETHCARQEWIKPGLSSVSAYQAVFTLLENKGVYWPYPTSKLKKFLLQVWCPKVKYTSLSSRPRTPLSAWTLSRWDHLPQHQVGHSAQSYRSLALFRCGMGETGPLEQGCLGGGGVREARCRSRESPAVCWVLEIILNLHVFKKVLQTKEKPHHSLSRTAWEFPGRFWSCLHLSSRSCRLWFLNLYP